MGKIIAAEIAYEYGKAYSNLMKVNKIFEELQVPPDQIVKLNEIINFVNQSVMKL